LSTGANFFLNYQLYRLKITRFIAQKHLYGAIYSSGYGTELNQS
jgi:hypothetical protein